MVHMFRGTWRQIIRGVPPKKLGALLRHVAESRRFKRFCAFRWIPCSFR